MFQELKIACLKAGISISEFARRIGKSRTAVQQVAKGISTSAEIERAIKEFIAEHNPEGVSSAATVHELPGQWLTTAEFAFKKGMRPESVANKCRANGFSRCRREGKKWLIHVSELGA